MYFFSTQARGGCSILLLALFFLAFASAQSASPIAPSSASPSPPISQTTGTASVPSTGPSSTTKKPTKTSTAAKNKEPDDVFLDVPELSVGRIELDVDNLQADINLNANVANLVSINAGVAVSIEKVNLTIAEVNAELELRVRLGHLVDIVNRVFESLDLNPLLISAINGVTDIIGSVIGAVDGLLGSITQDGKTLNFLIDNLGNIVQEVVDVGGDAVSTIVGNFEQNMTFTGVAKQLGNGLVQKEYRYSPLNSLVNIVFNAAGQVVQAVVAKPSSTPGTSTSSSVAQPTGSAAARRA